MRRRLLLHDQPGVSVIDFVPWLFQRLSTSYGRKKRLGGVAHWKPSKVFPDLQIVRGVFGVSQDARDRRPPPGLIWQRSVAERLMMGYLRRRFRRLGMMPTRIHVPALEVFRLWFEDRTGYRSVENLEQLYEAAEGLGRREWVVCVEVAASRGWKVVTPEPDEEPLRWDWTCGKCGAHTFSVPFHGIGICGKCQDTFTIKG